MSENQNEKVEGAQVDVSNLEDTQKAAFEGFYRSLFEVIEKGKPYAAAVEAVANAVGSCADAWKANAMRKIAERTAVLETLKTVQDDDKKIKAIGECIKQWAEEDKNVQKRKKENRDKIVAVVREVVKGTLGACAIIGAAALWKNKPWKTNLITTGYLLNNVRETEDLKCCYVDVLRAYGEMKALKDEEKDLWEQLVLLKRILETLIFKGTYGAKLKTGGRELKKLLNEIIIDSNHTGRWMQGLNEDERNELYSQAREIGKTLGLDAYKNR